MGLDQIQREEIADSRRYLERLLKSHPTERLRRAVEQVEQELDLKENRISSGSRRLAGSSPAR